MLALVDYDNIDRRERQRGLVHLASRISLLAGGNAAGRAPRLRIRLYGGWFDETRLSKLAQTLSEEIATTFPRPLPLSVVGQSITTVVSMELALALLCDPSHALTHTFRPRTASPGLRTEAPPYAGCGHRHTCPLEPVHIFLKQGRCPAHGCNVEPTGILRRGEQKMVDVMLVCDLVHAARGSDRQIVVVSTDDDLIPGIRLALLNNMRITHIHPVPGRATPSQYGHIKTTEYRETSF